MLLLKGVHDLIAKGTIKHHKRIIAIGGGKGGIGKSVFASNLAFALVRNAKRVVLVNLDLGSDNTGILLGIKPATMRISNFISGEIRNINDVVVKTSYDGLGIIRGSSGHFRTANLKFFHKRRIIKHLRNIDADYIILDLGGGFSLNTLDFFNCADEKLLVFIPEPTSITDAYSFIKCAIYRKLTRTFYKNDEASLIINEAESIKYENIAKKMNDLIANLYEENKDLSNIAMNMLNQFRPKLILNMATDKSELKLADKIRDVSKRFLNIETEFFGIIDMDDEVKSSVKQMKPLAVAFPFSNAAKKVNLLAKKLIDAEKGNPKVFSKIREINEVDQYFFNLNNENFYKIVNKIPAYSNTITEVECKECGEDHFYLPFQYNSGIISCKSCGYHMDLKEIFFSLNERSKAILIKNDLTRGILEADHFSIS